MIRRAILIVLLLLAVSSIGSAEKVVFGFWPEYIDNTGDGSFASYTPDWGNLTHVSFSVIKVRPSGNLDMTSWNQHLYDSVNDNATRYNVNTVIMIWPESFTNECFNSIINTNRSVTTTNLAAFMNSQNADGLNLDFEFFNNSSSFNGSMPVFLNELNGKMEAYNPNAELSICVMGGGNEVLYRNTSVSNAVDYMVLLGYDYKNGQAVTTGPVAPIDSILSSLDMMELYYPENKIILALPMYGYEWEADSLLMGATTNGNYTARRLYQALTYGEGHTLNRDTSSGDTPWYAYTSGGKNLQCWYDDNVSLNRKIDQSLANTDLGGIGVWALGYEAYYPTNGIIQMVSEKLNAVDNAFTGTTITQSPSHSVATLTQIGQSIPSNQTTSLQINLSSSAQNPYTERANMNLSAWWKIDDGTGTSLADATGNAHTGTTHGTVSWATTGKYNQSLYCDGTSGYWDVTVPDNFDIGKGGGRQFSIVGWINPRATIHETDIFTVADAVTDNGLEFYASGGKWKIQYMNASYTYRLTGGTKLNDTWQQVGASVNATHLNMYYNGALVNSTAIVRPLQFTEGQEFWVQKSVGRGWTRGWADDIIFKINTPLTTAQVSTLYYDPIMGIKTKTNTNTTYSGYWNSSANNPITIPISSLGGIITTLSHTAPTNVTLGNVKTYYYTPEYIAPLSIQVHTEDVVLSSDINASLYHNVSLLHHVQYNSTSGVIEYTLNDSTGINLEMISTNPNATISGNGTLFEITTGLLKSGTSYTYNVSVEHPITILPGIHEGFMYQWNGTAWNVVGVGPTNNDAWIGGQLEVTLS